MAAAVVPDPGGAEGSPGSPGQPGNSGDGAKVTLHTVKENLKNMVELKAAHKERLEQVGEEVSKLEKFREDYVVLQRRLRTLADKTSYEVMVPMGPLAFMPGQLVHTNELMVLLGDNWFAERSAKQAVAIVSRRIKDCDEKLKTARSTQKMHKEWLREAEEVLTGEAGQQVEIIEEMTEEEYQRTRGKSRRSGKTESPLEQLRPTAADEPSSAISKDSFVQGLSEQHQQTYDDLMRRLDELELQEEYEAVDDGSSGVDDGTEEEDEEESHASSDREDGGEEGWESAVPPHLSTKPKLRRKVSWADDIRPLFTVIPDDESKEIYRIQYTSGPPPMATEQEGEKEGGGEEDGARGVTAIHSPSDIYKVFALELAHSDSRQPRGILKKSNSLPNEERSDSGEVWCLPPKDLDEDEDDEDQHQRPTPPPSPPPRRSSQSLLPAFTYQVVERQADSVTGAAAASQHQGEAGDAAPPAQQPETAPPKKVSKFKASRTKK